MSIGVRAIINVSASMIESLREIVVEDVIVSLSLYVCVSGL